MNVKAWIWETQMQIDTEGMTNESYDCCPKNNKVKITIYKLIKIPNLSFAIHRKKNISSYPIISIFLITKL